MLRTEQATVCDKPKLANSFTNTCDTLTYTLKVKCGYGHCMRRRYLFQWASFIVCTLEQAHQPAPMTYSSIQQFLSGFEDNCISLKDSFFFSTQNKNFKGFKSSSRSVYFASWKCLTEHLHNHRITRNMFTSGYNMCPMWSDYKWTALYTSVNGHQDTLWSSPVTQTTCWCGLDVVCISPHVFCSINANEFWCIPTR